MTTKAHETILIVDFGSQVTQLIARRVRAEGVYCEIHPFDKSLVAYKRLRRHLKGIIFSGGPASVLDKDAPLPDISLYQSGLPILGICYGQQVMAAQLGGTVEGGRHREFGQAYVEIFGSCPLFEGVWTLGRGYSVWMSHGDQVVRTPPGFSIVGVSKNAPVAVMQDQSRNFYATQFHLEVIHTPDGAKLLHNFVRKICGCKGDWSMYSYKREALRKIGRQVQSGRVVCGLSGGVDSAVTAVLLHEEIDDRLTCVFVDNGLLRLGEREQVETLFRTHYNIPLVVVDASDRFFAALQGVTDPEQKRKTIGGLFVDVFEEEARKIADDGRGPATFLAQGTLYPDVIESVSFAGAPSVTIKSHHNVGGLPARMKLKLVEPLRELFKDEVRELGNVLELPEEFVGRHPFPGPGLAIRMPGEVTREKCDILRQADHIFIDEIRKAGLYDKIWQAYVALLPTKTVGVMGDGRTYEYIAWLRAVTSVDGMTADFYPFDPAFLGRVATRIVNEVKGVNRVGYDYTGKPPGTIELE